MSNAPPPTPALEQPLKLTLFSSQPPLPSLLPIALATLLPNTPITVLHLHDRLTPATAALAAGSDIVSTFTSDDLSAPTLQQLAAAGTKAILVRCAGHDNIDLHAAEQLSLWIANVPAYSPESVAEHALALLLAVLRHTAVAVSRTRQGDFRTDGLLGATLHGKTVGLLGTGKIGVLFAQALVGLGALVVAYDPARPPGFEALGGVFVDMDTLLAESDVLSLHCPLTARTEGVIDAKALASLKKGAYLVNVSRGGLVDTQALLQALKSGQLAGAGLDVLEGEEDLFGTDARRSGSVGRPELWRQLLALENVVLTPHVAFFTTEAVLEIVRATVGNLADWVQGRSSVNQLTGRSAGKK